MSDRDFDSGEEFLAWLESLDSSEGTAWCGENPTLAFVGNIPHELYS